MTEQPRPDDLARLHAELATQHARIARLERRRLRPARALTLLLIALLVALIPLTALAANPFSDLVPGSIHNADIDAIYAAGITTGCDPGVAYCPNDSVTRQEMASFLARTAGLGGNPPVADARTLGGYAPDGLVRAARGTGHALPDALVLAPAYRDVAAVAIAAPGPGVVVVTGTAAFVRIGNADNIVEYRLRAVGGADPPSPALAAAIGNTGGGANQSAAATYAFAVAGGPQTFALEARMFAGTGAAFNGSLAALYVPFGPTGATP